MSERAATAFMAESDRTRKQHEKKRVLSYEKVLRGF